VSDGEFLSSSADFEQSFDDLALRPPMHSCLLREGNNILLRFTLDGPRFAALNLPLTTFPSASVPGVIL
jgi:hypothetical protein